MPSKKANSSPVGISMLEPPAPSPLKRHSPYDRSPWQPGEVPAGPFMKTLRPLDQAATPYGHGSLGVEKPAARGKRYPLRAEIEGPELGNKGIK